MFSNSWEYRGVGGSRLSNISQQSSKRFLNISWLTNISSSKIWFLLVVNDKKRWGWKGCERDRLITTTTPPRTPFPPRALIRCPNIFPRGHSHLYLTDHLHRDSPHHSLEVFGRKSWEFGCVICWYLEIYWHLPQQVGSGSNEGKEPESDFVKEEVFQVYK